MNLTDIMPELSKITSEVKLAGGVLTKEMRSSHQFIRADIHRAIQEEMADSQHTSWLVEQQPDIINDKVYRDYMLRIARNITCLLERVTRYDEYFYSHIITNDSDCHLEQKYGGFDHLVMAIYIKWPDELPYDDSKMLKSIEAIINQAVEYIYTLYCIKR